MNLKTTNTHREYSHGDMIVGGYRVLDESLNTVRWILALGCVDGGGGVREIGVFSDVWQ